MVVDFSDSDDADLFGHEWNGSEIVAAFDVPESFDDNNAASIEI